MRTFFAYLLIFLAMTATSYAQGGWTLNRGRTQIQQDWQQQQALAAQEPPGCGPRANGVPPRTAGYPGPGRPCRPTPSATTLHSLW